MSLSAKLGKGSTITWDGTRVYDVKKIGDIPLENSEVEVTDLDSLAKEFIAGIKDYGTLSIEGNWVATDPGQVKLQADGVSGTLRTCSVFIASFAATFTFTAFIKSFKFAASTVDGVLPFTADLRISGAVNAVPSAGLTTTFFAISESAVIVPAPANAVYEYVADVLTGVTSVTITPVATAGVITVNGNTVATGVPSSAIVLGAAGSITTATIKVKETGKSEVVYTIHIVRAAT